MPTVMLRHADDDHHIYVFEEFADDNGQTKKHY